MLQVVNLWYDFRVALVNLIAPSGYIMRPLSPPEPTPVQVVPVRQTNERWHEYCVRVLTYEKGLVEEAKGIRVREEAITAFEEMCNKYPETEVYRVECLYKEYLGDKSACSREISVRKKEKQARKPNLNVNAKH